MVQCVARSTLIL